MFAVHIFRHTAEQGKGESALDIVVAVDGGGDGFDDLSVKAVRDRVSDALLDAKIVMIHKRVRVRS